MLGDSTLQNMLAGQTKKYSLRLRNLHPDPLDDFGKIEHPRRGFLLSP
jgi:hypothetical protein